MFPPVGFVGSDVWMGILLGGVGCLGDTSSSFLGLVGVGELLRKRDLVSCALPVGVGDGVDRWRRVSWYSLSPFGGGLGIFCLLVVLGLVDVLFLEVTSA